MRDGQESDARVGEGGTHSGRRSGGVRRLRVGVRVARVEAGRFLGLGRTHAGWQPAARAEEAPVLAASLQNEERQSVSTAESTKQGKNRQLV